MCERWLIKGSLHEPFSTCRFISWVVLLTPLGVRPKKTNQTQPNHKAVLLQFGADLETCSLSWCPCSCRCCACLLFCQHEILICLWTPPGHLQIANVFRKELAIREYLSAGHWSYCFWNGTCSSYRIFCFAVFKRCLPFEVAGWRIPSWKQSSSGLMAHKARWLMRTAQVVVSFSGQAVSVSCVISNVYSAFLYAWGITVSVLRCCYQTAVTNKNEAGRSMEESSKVKRKDRAEGWWAVVRWEESRLLEQEALRSWGGEWVGKKAGGTDG